MIKNMESKVLQEVNSSLQGIEPFELAKTIGCIDKFDKFTQTIKKLADNSDIIISKKGKILSLEAVGYIKCTIISQSLHFAFARKVGTFEDFYVAKEELKGAILKDTVLLYNIKETNRGNSGEVFKIVEVASHTFTGTLVKNGNYLDFKPDAPFRFTIPLKRMVERPPFKIEENIKIYADIVFDNDQQRLYAHPIKSYGNAKNAKVCADAIIDANGIIVEFSKKALNEAKKIKEKGVTKEEIQKRLDLRNENIFTIDGEDAKDLDDAICVKKVENGYQLGVHIADVSHYVKEGTTLDNEAFERGTSVYFADRVIPMLPEDISNGICSLNANEDKLTLSAIIDLDDKGRIKGYDVKKTVIRSKVRGVYSEINKIFDGTADNHILEKYSPVMNDLEVALELSDKIQLLSKKRGTLDLESKESRFFIDKTGKCVDIKPRVSGRSEKLIEQMMLTANEAVACYAKNLEIPFVYRVHDNPPLDRLELLSKLASTMGFSTRKLNSEVRSCDFANLLEEAKDSRYKVVINHQILRTMAKAKYDTNPIGHFGLSLEDYCHFTSPIRRYPDTAIHRILSALLEGKHPSEIVKYYSGFVQDVASNSSKCEISAMNAERSAEKCYMAEYILQYLGEEFEGVVSGVTQYGVYVELTNTVEGFIRSEFLPRTLEYDGSITYKDRASKKDITIGSSMKIVVSSADVTSGMIDFMAVRERKMIKR